VTSEISRDEILRRFESWLDLALTVEPPPGGIDADLLSRRLNHVLDRKFNKVVRAFRRRMADGIAQNDGARSASNCGVKSAAAPGTLYSYGPR